MAGASCGDRESANGSRRADHLQKSYRRICKVAFGQLSIEYCIQLLPLYPPRQGVLPRFTPAPKGTARPADHLLSLADAPATLTPGAAVPVSFRPIGNVVPAVGRWPTNLSRQIPRCEKNQLQSSWPTATPGVLLAGTPVSSSATSSWPFREELGPEHRRHSILNGFILIPSDCSRAPKQFLSRPCAAQRDEGAAVGMDSAELSPR